MCNGTHSLRLRCRERPSIRAERLEEPVWNEVKRVIQNPDLIVAGIDTLDAQEGGGLEAEIAQAERDLRSIQMEEDRAIRLFVSGKITEAQLDHQRRFITERLESARARLDDYRAREAGGAEKRRLMEAVLAWAREVGKGLDELTDEQRKEILQMVVDQVAIDRNNNVDITLAIPIDGNYPGPDAPEPDSSEPGYVAIASDKSYLNATKLEDFIIGKIRERILTEETITELVTLVAEEIDVVAGEIDGKLKAIGAEIADVEGRLENLYQALETKQLPIEVLSPRILALKSRQDQLTAAKEETEDQLERRRADLPTSKEIKRYVADFREFLQNGPFPERKALIRNFVKRIEIVEDQADLTYTIPMPQDGVTSESAPVLDFVQSGPLFLAQRDYRQYRSGGHWSSRQDVVVDGKACLQLR